MRNENVCFVVALVVGLAGGMAAQEISTIGFETIPEGTRVIGGGQEIGLEGDTGVAGNLRVDGDLSVAGAITSDTGIRFPDGSVQVTANGGVSANAALYSNTIADFSPPNAYTEVCIKSGQTMFDIHQSGEPTAGGNCEPGDIGWVIERFERNSGTATSWAEARLDCLADRMRLPEVFGWQVTCENATDFAVSDMEDDGEWTSNIVQGATFDPGLSLIAIPVIGNGS
jgi:hypothetical protein